MPAKPCPEVPHLSHPKSGPKSLIVSSNIQVLSKLAHADRRSANISKTNIKKAKSTNRRESLPFLHHKNYHSIQDFSVTVTDKVLQ